MMPATGYRPVGPGSGGAPSSGGRTILAGNTSYYVAITGSDSNPGTSGSRWATLQHAMDFIAAKLDVAGFVVTVNIGAGTFVGVGLKACVGGGVIYYLGAGSGSTLIGAGPNDGVFNFSENLSCYVPFGNNAFAVNGVKFITDPAGYAHFAIVAQCNLTFGSPTFNAGGDVVFDTNYGTAATWFVGFAQVSQITFNTAGTFAFNFSPANSSIAGSIAPIWIYDAACIVGGGTFTINGNPTFTIGSGTGGFLNIFSGGIFDNLSANVQASVTGSCSGPFAFLQDGGIFSAKSTFTLPGSSTIVADSSSSYAGLSGPLPGVNTQTSSYTLALTDYYGRVEMNLAGANTVTVPTDATVLFPIGAEIGVTQIGAGATTIAGAGGVTVHNAGAIAAQWDTVTLYKRAANEWVMTP